MRLTRPLIVIGLLGTAAFVVEGGTESWSALFLARVHDASPSVSGLGPGVFGASMAAGRFFGQAAGRIGDRALLVGGAVVGTAGCLLAALSPNAELGLIGFAIGGAGVSLNAPIIFGLAGRRPDAATAVATVTTIGYLGILTGAAARRARRTGVVAARVVHRPGRDRGRRGGGLDAASDRLSAFRRRPRSRSAPAGPPGVRRARASPARSARHARGRSARPWTFPRRRGR